MNPKRRDRLKEERNLPIPLVLFTSYIAAEKSDELIKVFCKELPDILKNINDCKKALENRTKAVYKLKEGIKHDLKKLELASIILKELYKEEEEHKVGKEKELQMLHLKISDCQSSKTVLNSSLLQFCESKKALDAIAVESSRYENAQTLIQSYLTLQAMNEKLIRDQFESKQKAKDIEEENAELERMLLKHKYDVMTRENRLDKLLSELQDLENTNHNLNSSLNEALSHQRQEHLEWIQMKRWAYDTCQKLGFYKETPSSTQDYMKLINEIQEFIMFSNYTLLKL